MALIDVKWHHMQTKMDGH